MRRIELLLSVVVISSLAACSSGSGTSSQKNPFKLVTVNVANGGIVALNQPIEMNFNDAVDLSTVSLGSTISITGTSSSPAITNVPPVTGIFYVKPGTNGQTLVFQPNCPNDSANSNGGFLPSDSLGNVVYTLSVLDLGNGLGQTVRSLQGTPLGQGLTFNFISYPLPNPFVDPVPAPPAVNNLSEISATIALNLLSDPVSPIVITTDQPVQASNFQNDWFFLTYEDSGSPGTYIRVPSTLTIAENCNSAGGAKFLLTPIGILPSGTNLLLVEGAVQGYGEIDTVPQNVVLKTIMVATAASPQPDSIFETFDDDTNQDTSALGFPTAEWGNGVLQATAPFPGLNVNVDIDIGLGTANGFDRTVDTTSSTLLATDGSTVTITNGIIYCRNFHLLRDTAVSNQKHGRLTGIGPNPLRIIATGSVTFDKDTIVTLEGVDSVGVITVQSGNVPEPGASGRCGGGDGGTGSPIAVGSSAAGGDGNGPFNIAGAGGRGGHAGYGATALGTYTSAPFTLTNCFGASGTVAAAQGPVVQVKGSGGGGGSFSLTEIDGDETGPFCYGRFTGLFPTNCTCTCNYPGCTMTQMLTGADTPPCGPATDSNGFITSTSEQTGCGGAQPSTNTLGEAGSRGPLGTGPLGGPMTNGPMPNGDNFTLGTETLSTIFDAVTGLAGPVGGAAGPQVFVDGDLTNDFFGTKILTGGGILQGELVTVQGGQGGGAGGDAIGSTTYPPPATYNSVNDFKGSAGGGGGGVFWVQAIGQITVNGRITADGGDGGGGELYICMAPSGGGSGGGAGGMIILESLTGVALGTVESVTGVPQLSSRGGDRGWGTSLKNSININGTNYNEKCNMNVGCISALPLLSGGVVSIWNPACTQGNANANGNQGLPGRSRRTLSLARGGAGGAGQIIIGVPLNADGTLKANALTSLALNPTTGAVTGPFDMSTVTCGGPTNDCYDDSAGQLRFKEYTTTLTTFSAKPQMSPDPHIVYPSFGPISKARSSWQYIGAASASFSFGGTDTQGEVDVAAAEQVLASANSGVTVESANQATIQSAGLYSAVAANPKVLIGDHFLPNGTTNRFSIVNAELVTGSSNKVRVFTDPADGTLPSPGNWQLIRRFYDLVTAGTFNTLPSASSVQIVFQGADESSPGVVDTGTISPSSSTFTYDPSTLDGKKFIRYQVTFNLLTTGSPDANLIDKSRPALRTLKLPFTY